MGFLVSFFRPLERDNASDNPEPHGKSKFFR